MVHEPPSLNLVIARDSLYHGPFGPLRVILHALADRPEDKVASIRVPTLVIRGAADRIAPARWADELAARAPQGRSLTLPGAHTIVYSSPEPLARLVAEVARSAKVDADASSERLRPL